jgi:hypothetical protein
MRAEHRLINLNNKPTDYVMTILACYVFPFLSIGCGIAAAVSLIKFVAEIQRDIRANKP